MTTSVLCVDVGNSRIKFAVVSNKRVLPLASHPTGQTVLGGWRDELRRKSRVIGDLEGAIVSSVVPSLNKAIRSQVERAIGCKPLVVSPRLRMPFKLGVKESARLGMDRVCAAAGAARHGARSFVVIDVGSAITIDLVTEGKYRGGLILAGPALNLRALGEFTDRLPRLGEERLIGWRGGIDGTEKSMLTGAVVGTRGSIREAVRHLEGKITGDARKYVTGGGARFLSLPRSWVIDRDLVFHGLFRLWRMNAQ